DQLTSMQTVSKERFVYDGRNLIFEISNPESQIETTKSFLWGQDLSGSMQGAGGVGGLLSVTDDSSGDVFYATYDANGNVSEYLDETGAIAAHYEYSSFGRVIASTGSPDDFDFRFSTKYQDNETNLLYYGFRYYDPEMGRWASRDPIGERGGLNLYGFVGNGSVNWVDVLGLAEFTDLFGNTCQDSDSKSIEVRVRSPEKSVTTQIIENKSISGVDTGHAYLFDPQTGVGLGVYNRNGAVVSGVAEIRRQRDDEEYTHYRSFKICPETRGKIGDIVNDLFEKTVLYELEDEDASDSSEMQCVTFTLYVLIGAGLQDGEIDPSVREPYHLKDQPGFKPVGQ
ncbi:MAG: RHS repeat-associated core domain-containing protein, partial [Verrucomicrobiales bacterium]